MIDYPVLGLTWEELADKIDSEGYDYFWTSWVSLDEINDPKLRELAEAYRKAETDLSSYLADNGGIL